MIGQDENAKDQNHPDNEVLTSDKIKEGSEEGPAGQRGCTNCSCVILICAAWFAMTILGFMVLGWVDGEPYGLKKGNPYRLTNAVDWQGQLCGFGEDVIGKSKAWYMLSGEVVCIEECPTETDFTTFVCKNDGTTDVNMAELYAMRSNSSIPAEIAEAAYIAAGFYYVSTFDCMFIAESKTYLGYCMPEALEDAAIAAAGTGAAAYANETAQASSLLVDTSSGAGAKDMFESFCADLFAQAGVIFGFGLGFAVVASFTYIWILRIPGVLALIIWGLLTAIQVILLGMAGLAYNTAGAWQTAYDNDEADAREKYQVDFMWGFTYFLLAVAGLWFCVIFCCLRKRIMLAIAVVQEAGRALSAQKMLILFPVFQCFGCAVFLVPWTFYALFLGTSGEVVTVTQEVTYMGVTSTTEVRQYVYNENQSYAALYLLFIWFWTSEFIIAMGQLVVALAISSWYFTRERESKIGNTNVIWSVKTAFRYHMGSGAFGALIIAIIKTIRAIVAYLQKKAKKSGNKLAIMVLCIIQSCMWCVEKTMKFINKNAYIQIAIFGFSFCKAARRAFFLIARNILRIAATSIVSSFVLLIGKVLVPFGTTFVAYLYLTASGDSENMASTWAPLFFIFCLAWFTLLMFNEVFGMAIWTILQCFVADEEMFGKSGHMFCPGTLQSCITSTQKKAMELEQAKGAKVQPEEGP